MRYHLQEVERTISQGVYRITWNTLSIQDYTSNCTHLLMNAEGMVEQIKDFSTRMEESLKTISKFDLFQPGINNNEVLPLKVKNKPTYKPSTS